jgi:hypothetical protein
MRLEITGRSIEMTVETKLAKHAVLDQLESMIKTAEAKLETLRARAEAAKASAEIKAIAEIASHRIQIRQKLEELRKATGSDWELLKKNLESQVAEFQKTVKNIEAKVHVR